LKIHCRYDELVNPASLKANPKNPNIHSIEGATRLIKLFGFYGIRHPIVVSKQSGMIVAGHGRHMAALMAEMPEFPVVYQDFETPDEEYGFLVADNGSQDWSELDLAKINIEIPHLGLDDIDLLGLKDFALDPSELPPKQKKPKMCPHCGCDVNQPPV
jgi:hypothetical protein